MFSVVAAKTGDAVRAWGSPAFAGMFFNQSYPGLFNSGNKNVPLPVPNSGVVWRGRTVLQKIQDVWGAQQAESYYSSKLEVPDGLHPPVYP